MKKTRRVFLTQLTVLTGGAAIGSPLLSAAKTSNHYNLLSANGGVAVYHTNDLNGQTAPVYRGLGGLAQIKSRLQNEGKKGVLVDAGGFMSDCRNADGRTKMINLMNATGYQAAGLSNRELAGGAANLAALAKAMRFKLVNCNHTFNGVLDGVIEPYTLINYNGIKIGVTGVCKKLKGIKYADPAQSANRIAAKLKNQHGCDLVICLSQLGHSKRVEQVNDLTLAAQTQNIDVIIGSANGNTGGKTMALKNAAGGEVLLGTAGRNGLTAGKLIFNFGSAGEKRFVNSEQRVSGAPAGQHAAVAMPNLEKIKDKLILV